MPSVLWWGRFDPNYSRNRILRQLLVEQGWVITDFHPLISRLGDYQAALRAMPRPDAVWVPCFRQRDVRAAARWAKKQRVPLIFDPLISAYDKQVDERRKLSAHGGRARQLLYWERGLFNLADRVIADTWAHADYFQHVLDVPRDKISVLMVGAEPSLFKPCARLAGEERVGKLFEVLFYGSFLPLQGPDFIVEAARICRSEPIRWTMLGDGPLRPACERQASDLSQVRFEPWVDYSNLPSRICQADLLLGVFGTTPKAGRVVPNKVYQALACARPLVTRHSTAYPEGLLQSESGIVFVPPGDSAALAAAVSGLLDSATELASLGQRAACASEQWFSVRAIGSALEKILSETVR